MRLVPETAAELGSNIQWLMDKRLEIIKEIALGSRTCTRDILDMDEAWERMRKAVERRDREAEDEAVVDRTIAEVWEWWREFPERWLLTRLYERAVLREAGCGNPDKQRRPSHSERLRIAMALLANLSDKSPLDPEHESKAVAQVLADQLLSRIGGPSRPGLRDCIRRSESSRTHFDALSIICEALHNQDKAIPGLLTKWQGDVASGRRQRPAVKPVAAHSPTNPDRLKRDIHVQFTIELLDRLGVPPYGSYVSGCSTVWQALLELTDCGILPESLGLSEGSVERIWKECTWRTSFMPVMRKYSKPIAERTGLIPTED